MVRFNTDIDTSKDRGICERIRDQKADMIVDMVNRSSVSGKELAVAFVEDTNGVLHETGEVEGTEERIATDALDKLRSEVVGMVSSYDPWVTPAHLLHTHPAGFPNLSVADIMAFMAELRHDDMFMSVLAATQYNPAMGWTMINGAKLVDKPHKNEKRSILMSVVETKNMLDEGDLSERQAKQQLWGMMGTFYEDCSAVIK